MAQASLDALLVEIIQSVEKNSTDYRNFKSNKLIHGITVDHADISLEIQKEFRALLNIDKLDSSLVAFIEKEALDFTKKMHTAIAPPEEGGTSNFDPKGGKWVQVTEFIGNQTSFSFSLVPKPGKSASIFNAFKKVKQAQQGTLNKNLKARLKLENSGAYDKFTSTKQGQAFLDIGHEGGSSVSAQRLAAVTNTINRFAVTTGSGEKADAALTQAIKEALGSLKWSIQKNDDGPPVDIVRVKFESKEFNRQNKNEVLHLNKTITKMVENIGVEFAEVTGSDSSISKRQKMILKQFEATLKGKKGVKLTGFDTAIIASHKGLISKDAKSGKASTSSSLGSKGSKTTRRRKAANKGVSSSPLAMIVMLNKKLPDTVRKNMTSPRLQNRTGRFAQSVKITDIMMTPQGFPSIGYTYQRDPYQVFEDGSSGNWSNEYRDPRKLIDKSIRELAATTATGRFYTRRT
jgi:hypothetical protein